MRPLMSVSRKFGSWPVAVLAIILGAIGVPQMAVGAADVYVMSISCSDSVEAGNSVTISYTVGNKGNVSAVSSHTLIQIKNYSLTSTIAQKVFSDPSVGAYSSRNNSHSLTVPSGTAPGYYWVCLVLDNQSEIPGNPPANDWSETVLLQVTSAADTTPPSMSISSPCSSSCSSSESPITVSGTATDTGGSGLYFAMVTNQTDGNQSYYDYISGNSSSFWISGVELVEGRNTLAVLVSDYEGNYKTIYLTVTYEPADETPPTVPTGLSVTATSPTQISLSWNASSDSGSGVDGYRVYRNGTYIDDTWSTSYVDEGRTPNTNYCYTVRAYDEEGNVSGQSSSRCATTPQAADTAAPSVPTALTATAVSSTEINLTWNASTDSGGSGIGGYRVYRFGTQIATTTGTSYSDTGRTPGTEYCYAVRAYDRANNQSGASTQACATTGGQPGATLRVTSVDPAIVVGYMCHNQTITMNGDGFDPNARVIVAWTKRLLAGDPLSKTLGPDRIVQTIPGRQLQIEIGTGADADTFTLTVENPDGARAHGTIIVQEAEGHCSSATGALAQCYDGGSSIKTPDCDVVAYARQAGFSGESLVTAVAVAYAESRFTQNVYNSTNDYGLWQINVDCNFSSADRAQGIREMLDPRLNAQKAWELSRSGTYWSPWVTYKQGLLDYQRARDIVAACPAAGSSPATPQFSSVSYRSSQNHFYPTNAPKLVGGQLESDGNCTWFAYGRLLELGFSESSINCLRGDAKKWASQACDCGYGLSRIPVVNSVAQVSTGERGHVAIVKEILADGRIRVEESSYSETTGDFLYKDTRVLQPDAFCWYITPKGYGETPSCSELGCGVGRGGAEDLESGQFLEIDSCPDDPEKVNAGVCGCGIPDFDSDADGTPDCVDDCPYDNCTAYIVLSAVSPADGGRTSGDGFFLAGQSVTLSATPEEGYTFTHWSENGSQVSTSPVYSFVADRDRTLVAIFSAQAADDSGSPVPSDSSIPVAGICGSGFSQTITLCLAGLMFMSLQGRRTRVP